MATPFTAKQSQYLAFIYYYSKIHGIPPAEADFRRFFRITPPVVHQMIKTLHAHGFIDREPGKARSIRLDSLVQNCRIRTDVGSSVPDGVEDQQRWMNSRISGSSRAMQRELHRVEQATR
jgi:SOS-response transcriptional repressor LexA